MVVMLLSFLRSFPVYFWSSTDLQTEILALRHQIVVPQRRVPRPKLKPADRHFGSVRFDSGPDGVGALDRQTSHSCRMAPSRVPLWYWIWKVRHGQPGRPSVAEETRELIGALSRENVGWGAPRIHSE